MLGDRIRLLRSIALGPSIGEPSLPNEEVFKWVKKRWAINSEQSQRSRSI